MAFQRNWCPFELANMIVNPSEESLYMTDLSDVLHSIIDRSLENPLGKCLEFQLHVEQLLGIRNVTSFVVWKKLAGSLLNVGLESSISFVEDRIQRMEPDVDFYTLLEAGRMYAYRFFMQEKADEYYQKAKLTAGECVQSPELKNILCEIVIKGTATCNQKISVDDQLISSHSYTMNQYYDYVLDKSTWDEQVFIYVLLSRKLGQYALRSSQPKTWSLAAGLCGNALTVIEKFGVNDVLVAKFSYLKAHNLVRLKTEDSADQSVRLLLESWNLMENHFNNKSFFDHHIDYAIYCFDKASFVFRHAKKPDQFLEFLMKVSAILDASAAVIPIVRAYISTRNVYCYTSKHDTANAIKHLEESEVHLAKSKETYESDEQVKIKFWYRITETIRYQAVSYKRLQNLSKSEQKYKEAIEILVLAKGDNHHRVIWARADLVDLYLTWKKPRLAQRQLDIITSHAPENYRHGDNLVKLQCRIDMFMSN